MMYFVQQKGSSLSEWVGENVGTVVGSDVVGGNEGGYDGELVGTQVAFPSTSITPVRQRDCVEFHPQLSVEEHEAHVCTPQGSGRKATTSTLLALNPAPYNLCVFGAYTNPQYSS
jgi:hypothetical protein